MKVHLFSTLLMVFILVPTVQNLWAADTLTGTVKDSMTGTPLKGVKVNIVAKPCSTLTDDSGKFVLAIPISTSIIHSIKPVRVVRASSDDLMAINLRGCVVGESRISSGCLLFRSKGGAGFKALCLNPMKNRNFLVLSEQGVEETSVLAKTAATSSYKASFEVEGYKPASMTVVSGQPADVKLVPEGTTGNFNITIDSIGVFTVTTEIK